MSSRNSRQTGASLVLILGVSAILFVLALATFALVANAQFSRNRDRHRAMTFNAAEAAVDDALARLAASWPQTQSMSPVWGPAQEQAFKTSYLGEGLAAQYPTLRIKELFYDNSNKPVPVDNIIDATDYTYDAGGPNGIPDGQMYVEVQAQDGTRSTRIRVLAQRQPVSLPIPRGVVFYTAGDLETSGGSEVFAVDPGYGPPPGVQVTALVGNDYVANGSAESPTVVTYYGGAYSGPATPLVLQAPPDSPVPPLGIMLDPAVLDNLKGAASTATPTNYYTSVSSGHPDEKAGFTQAFPGMPETIEPMPPDSTEDDLSGLVYIEPTVPNNPINWQFKHQWNSPQHPGILIVDGDSLKSEGMEAADYYGLVYVNGGLQQLGNVKVHGMVICSGAGLADLTGSQNILYNDEVWRNLSQAYTASVRIVPNTWRELKPLMGVF